MMRACGFNNAQPLLRLCFADGARRACSGISAPAQLTGRLLQQPPQQYEQQNVLRPLSNHDAVVKGISSLQLCYCRHHGQRLSTTHAQEGTQLCCGGSFLSNVPLHWWRGSRRLDSAADGADSWNLAMEACAGLKACFPLRTLQQKQRQQWWWPCVDDVAEQQHPPSRAPRAALSRPAWKMLSVRGLALAPPARAPGAARVVYAARRWRMMREPQRLCHDDDAQLTTACAAAAAAAAAPSSCTHQDVLAERRAWLLARAARYVMPRSRVSVAAAHQHARVSALLSQRFSFSGVLQPQAATEAQGDPTGVTGGRMRRRMHPDALRWRLQKLRKLPAGSSSADEGLGPLLQHLGATQGGVHVISDVQLLPLQDDADVDGIGGQRDRGGHGQAQLLLVEMPSGHHMPRRGSRCSSNDPGGVGRDLAEGTAFRNERGVVYGWWSRCPLG